jgi:DNA-3-methyladenine glycosylase II
MATPQEDMLDFSFDAHASSVTMPLPQEFSYDETLTYLTRSPDEILHVIEDRKIYRLFELEREAVLIEISENGPSSIQIRFVEGKERNRAAFVAAVHDVREWFDLRTDLAPFYRMAEGDPLLGALTREYFGLRIIGVQDLFEAICWAVIGQQVNLTFAYTLKKRFIETFGEHIEWNGRRYWLFPKPRDIAAVSVEELKKLQFTGKKAEYIIAIAGLMDSGSLSKEALMATGDYQDAERQMLAIRGIGPWTAHYVMMRCLRDPSAFPIGDVGLQNALKQLLQRPQKPDLDEIRQIFAPWRNWEAYAVFYLWRSLALG